MMNERSSSLWTIANPSKGEGIDNAIFGSAVRFPRCAMQKERIAKNAEMPMMRRIRHGGRKSIEKVPSQMDARVQLKNNIQLKNNNQFERGGRQDFF